MASISEEQYKKEQLEFISNHGGSPKSTILLVILPNVMAIMVTHLFLLKYGSRIPKNIRTIVEFLLNVIPCILCCTIFSENLSLVLLIMSGALGLLTKNIGCDPEGMKPEKSTPKKIVFLTNFRALTNVITSVCILAVDFKIFPRKFAKTEVYGYSLMDTGVGLFIIANSLVAPEARDFSDGTNTNSIRSTLEKIKIYMKNSAPLLILGFGRFLSIEFLGYQKHVSEYGVHWNFFFTLAFVKIFANIIFTTIHPTYSPWIGLTILGYHEYILSISGLKDWILSDAERNNFVSANREGLFSLPGYIGLYILGITIGRIIHKMYNMSREPSSFKKFNVGLDNEFECNKNVLMVIPILQFISCLSLGGTFYFESKLGVSRRLVNSSYSFWIISLSAAVLSLLLVGEIIVDIFMQLASKTIKSIKSDDKRVKFDDNKESKVMIVKRTLEIFDAVNYNGLVFFLLSNLMTGLVNMTVKTLYVTTTCALLIILSYTAIIIVVAVILYRLKIQLKL